MLQVRICSNGVPQQLQQQQERQEAKEARGSDDRRVPPINSRNQLSVGHEKVLQEEWPQTTGKTSEKD